MSENKNPLEVLADLDTINPEAVVEEDDTVEETFVEEVFAAKEVLDEAPVPPEAVGRVARHDSNLTSRAQRKNRQRGR